MTQSKAPGIYRVHACHLRDEKHDIITSLRDGEQVLVMDDAPHGLSSRFGMTKLNFNPKDHTWVTYLASRGWIENSKLDPIMEQITGEAWSDGSRTVLIYENFNGDLDAVNVQSPGIIVGSLQAKSSGQILTASGFSADAAYRGLGSLLLLRKIARSGAQALRAENMVDSFGFWQKLGATVPASLIFDTTGMSGARIRDLNNQKKTTMNLQGGGHFDRTQNLNMQQAQAYLTRKAALWQLEEQTRTISRLRVE